MISGRDPKKKNENMSSSYYDKLTKQKGQLPTLGFEESEKIVESRGLGLGGINGLGVGFEGGYRTESVT